MLLFGPLSALAQTPAAVPQMLETTDAHAIYDAAYDRWNALTRAPFATYETTVTFVQHGRTVIRREDLAYRRRDHRCLIVGIALDARDRPDAPRITDRCFAPDSSFTLLRRDGALRAGPLPVDLATPGPSDEPRTIGHVVARTRLYEPVYVADELIGSHRTAHLALRSVGDPNRHALRDMWVDRETLGVVRLHGEAALAVHFASVDFTVDYEETAKSQIVRRIAGYVKAQLLLVKVGVDFGFNLANDAYPGALPDWYFAKGGYVSHHSPPILH